MLIGGLCVSVEMKCCTVCWDCLKTLCNWWLSAAEIHTCCQIKTDTHGLCVVDVKRGQFCWLMASECDNSDWMIICKCKMLSVFVKWCLVCCMTSHISPLWHVYSLIGVRLHDWFIFFSLTRLNYYLGFFITLFRIFCWKRIVKHWKPQISRSQSALQEFKFVDWLSNAWINSRNVFSLSLK